MYKDFFKNQKFLDLINRCIEIRNTDDFKNCFSNFLLTVKDKHNKNLSFLNYVHPNVDDSFLNYLDEINQDLNSLIFNDTLIINTNNHFNINKISFKEFMNQSDTNEFRYLKTFMRNLFSDENRSCVNFIPLLFSLEDKFDDIDFKFVFDVLSVLGMWRDGNNKNYGNRFLLKDFSYYPSTCCGCDEKLYPFYDFDKNELTIITFNELYKSEFLTFDKKCSVFNKNDDQSFNREITINIPSKKLIIANNFLPLLPNVNDSDFSSLSSIKGMDIYQKRMSELNVLYFISSFSNSLYRHDNDYVITHSCNLNFSVDFDKYKKEHTFDSDLWAVMAMDYDQFLLAIKNKSESLDKDDNNFKSEDELKEYFGDNSIVIELNSDFITFNLFNINDEDSSYFSFSTE